MGAGGARTERKVVTVLFADLVGFTSRAEHMDPEDVAGLLTPYHGHLRAELERHGGTVEKFIGDAVMALFGAPVAHEDDPERAVRAALAIRDWVLVEEADLQVRIAVNTGEALVTLDARPEGGEGMAAGDVVNTAARLQAAAPVNGVLVGETTYRATAGAIEYREAGAVEAKGKAEPIPVWEAVQARSRLGVQDVARGPLVGRARELDALTDALARMRHDQSPQLVTLVGVPGIGKSRLVWELFRVVEEDPELITWRQGRCLPYGEGVTFWAVAEMIKAHAGILETDSAAHVEEKLGRSVGELLGEQARWVEGHLRPLVGLGGDSELGEDRRGETFAAWRRFFEALADRSPTVLVFDDLQWADDGVLDFVDHLVDWASGVPLLVVCASRPELLDRRPGWGGGKRNAVTLSLSPLTDEETAALLAALLERSVLPAETQVALLARAGGNPLYAEQYARMLLERGELEELPETVQGIIAARLDALPPEEKAVLQDASVVGKVFWAGAVAAIGGSEPWPVEERLHALERKEFVQRARRSSVAKETEYAFRHVLVRDVAYGQIPRAGRAERHRLAAEWIESLGRPDDHAEMLAHHYLSALEFARAAGQPTQELEEGARPALREAGDRAVALSAFSAAARFYESALELTPEDDLGRPQLLFGLGRSRFAADFGGLEILTEARDALLEAGEQETAAEAEMIIGELVALTGQQERAFRHFRRASELVEDAPLAPAKAFVTSNLSRWLMLAGAYEEAIRTGRQALAMAEELGLDELRSHALDNIGVSRVNEGDLGGVADLEQSVAIALAADSPELARAYGNLASIQANLGDLEASWRSSAEGLRAAERFGLAEPIRWIRAERSYRLYAEGRWAEAVTIADEVIVGSEAGEPYFMEVPTRRVRGCIRLARGDADGAAEDAEQALAFVEPGADPQLHLPALAFAARTFEATGRTADATRLATELLHTWTEVTLISFDWVVDLALALLGIGQERELAGAAKGVQPPTPWLEAALALAGHDFEHAAAIFGAMGTLPEEADARLLAAEALVKAGRRAQADEQLRQALAFYRSVEATAYVRRGEALLAASA